MENLTFTGVHEMKMPKERRDIVRTVQRFMLENKRGPYRHEIEPWMIEWHSQPIRLTEKLKALVLSKVLTVLPAVPPEAPTIVLGVNAGDAWR